MVIFATQQQQSLTGFEKLVSAYGQNLMSSIMFTAKYGDEMPFPEKVLKHKVSKDPNDPRRVAEYLHYWVEAYGRDSIPQWMLELARSHKLRKSAKKEAAVGYFCERRQQWRWFGL